MTAPRVIQIGLNKCATRSLAALFERSGYPAVHYRLPEEAGGAIAATLMLRNRRAGRPLLAGFDDRVLYSDLERNGPRVRIEGWRMFRRLHADYPGSYFILNYRDREAWIRSRIEHPNYAENYRRNQGLADLDAVAEAWRREYDGHLAGVRRFFADKPAQLVEFDLDRDPVERLIAALPDHPRLDPAHWRRFGVTPARAR